MARRRFQKGSVRYDESKKQWTGRYLEDVMDARGIVTRVHRRVFLGTKAEVPTEKIARRKLEPLLVQVNDTASKPKTVTTFNEFLVRWEAIGMPTNPETARIFKGYLTNYLKPVFGNRYLSDIDTESVQRFVSQLDKVGPSSVRNILKVLAKVWKTAKAWGYVSHNPLADLIIPPVLKKEQRFFTEAEIALILTTAPEPYKTLYWLLAQTGLRIGEALALTWQTLDLDHVVVRVTSTVCRAKIREDQTKTETSKRVIPLSPRLAAHLFTFRTTIWTENKLNLVFANGAGNAWSAEHLRDRCFQPFLESLGIPKAGFHAFRHSSATILSRMNVPMEIRRARIGHTDNEMTLRYTHVIDEDARKVAANFDQYLLPETVGA